MAVASMHLGVWSWYFTICSVTGISTHNHV